jgi:hypothetical protein
VIDPHAFERVFDFCGAWSDVEGTVALNGDRRLIVEENGVQWRVEA